jgi:surfeit locus 1 family protein
MAAGYSFRPHLRPRIWPLLLAAVACAGAITLGNWQSRRADEKRALGAELDAAMRAAPVELSATAPAAGYVLKHVAAQGTFVPALTVFLDNKLRHGRPGYEVVTPLRLAGTDAHVMVDRGWLASPASRAAPPVVRTPAGNVRVEGLGLERLPHALQAGEADKGPVRQNLDLDAFAAQSGLRLVRLVIQQHSRADDGLLREWPRPDVGVEMHESYKLQWYSLAALAVVLGVVFAFRRVKPS